MTFEREFPLPKSVARAADALIGSEKSTDAALFMVKSAFQDLAGDFSKSVSSGSFDGFKVDRSDLPNVELKGVNREVFREYVPLDLLEVVQAFLPQTKLDIRVSVGYDYVVVQAVACDVTKDSRFELHVDETNVRFITHNIETKFGYLMASEDRSRRGKIALDFMKGLIHLAEDRKLRRNTSPQRLHIESLPLA